MQSLSSLIVSYLEIDKYEKQLSPDTLKRICYIKSSTNILLPVLPSASWPASAPFTMRWKYPEWIYDTFNPC